MSPIEPDLLAILVCPETHRPLRPMDEEALAAVNRRIAAGELTNRKGDALVQPLTEALASSPKCCRLLAHHHLQERVEQL